MLRPPAKRRLPDRVFDTHVNLADNVCSLVELVKEHIIIKKADLDSNVELDYIPWGWLCLTMLKLLLEFYSSPVTPMILLSELQKRWDESEHAAPHRITVKHLLQNKVSRSGVFEAVVKEVSLIPQANTYVLLLEDHKGKTIRAWLHSRFNPIADKLKDYQIRMTGLVVDRGAYPGNDARLLPTEFLVPVSRQVLDRFQTVKPAKLKQLPKTTSTSCCGTELTLAVVSKVESTSERARIEFQQAFMKSEKRECDEKRSLMLNRYQSVLAAVFRVNEYLVLQDVYVPDENPAVDLEYGSATVIHVVKQCSQLSQGSRLQRVQTFAHHQSAALESQQQEKRLQYDYRSYAERVTLAQLHPNMRNLTLVVRVLRMIANKPSPTDGRIRLGLVVQDDSVADPRTITLIGGLPPNLHLGDSNCANAEVLLENVATVTNEGSNVMKIALDITDAGKIIVVNRIPALLSSFLIGKRLSLHDALELSKQPNCPLPWCIVRVRVAELLTLAPGPICRIHSYCGEILIAEPSISPVCSFCGKPTVQRLGSGLDRSTSPHSLTTELISFRYNIAWRLQDPETAHTVDASATKQTNEFLLRIPPDRWNECTEAEREKELHRVLTTTYEMVVSLPCRTGAARTLFRIDQAVLARKSE